MWLLTNTGPVSVVAHRDKPGHYLARARRSEHLAAFLGDEPAIAIQHTPAADYAYRAYITAEQLEAMTLAQLRRIDYPNFKSSVQDNELHSAYSDVWARLGDLQDGGPYGAG